MINEEKIDNASQLLFYDKVSKYVDRLAILFLALDKTLNSLNTQNIQSQHINFHKGYNIHFTSNSTKPAFLIKNTLFNIMMDGESLLGSISNITGEQNLTRKPINLKLLGKNLKNLGSVNLTASINRVNHSNSHDTVLFNVNGLKLNKYRLVDRDNMFIYLDEALTDLSISATRSNQFLQADFKSKIHSIKYNNLAKGNELAMLFLSSINKSRAVTIYGKVRGDLSKQEIILSSNLDKRLNINLDSHIHRRLTEFNKQLKNNILRITSQAIHNSENELKHIKSLVKNDIALRKAYHIRAIKELNRLKQGIQKDIKIN